MFERLDFAAYYSPVTTERDEFCRRLVANLEKYGFVRMTNHGIATSMLDKAFDISRRFFHLSKDEKLKSPHPPTVHPHRGYSAYGVETIAKISNHGRDENGVLLPLLKDMKENYDIGSQHDPDYPNIWPPAGVCDEFQPFFMAFWDECYKRELDVLDAISTGLGLPTTKLRELHQHQHNEMRLAHYPRAAYDDFASATRIAAHTDFGSITLLFQDNHDGLQVEMPAWSGEFVDVPTGGPYECILNVADCLQKLTGLPSVSHRVHMPGVVRGANRDEDEGYLPERFSLAYFAKPDRHILLQPLLFDRVLAEKPGAKYQTAREFQLSRINGTYS